MSDDDLRSSAEIADDIVAQLERLGIRADSMISLQQFGSTESLRVRDLLSMIDMAVKDHEERCGEGEDTRAIREAMKRIGYRDGL